MATKIVTKNSSTASAVPTASDLVQGELAVNVTDKRLFTEDNGGSIVELGTNPSTIDINAGTIDGTAIGASSASTGAFTTLTATGAFTSRGIDDNADATAITIDSSENVGIGTTSPSSFNYLSTSPHLVVGGGSSDAGVTFYSSTNGYGRLAFADGTDSTEQYRGLIQYYHSDNSMQFYTGSDERMRIDSSGNVGIGTSSPTAPLSVLNAASTATTVQIGSSTLTHNTGIYLRTTGVAGLSWGSGGDLAFYGGGAGSAERMRIDSSGNLLVGTTDTTPGIGDTNAGISMSAANGIIISRANDAPINISRNSSDGALTYFRKDGAIVGSIGTNAATMYVSAPQAGGMKYSYLTSTNAVMLPVTTTGANADGLHDLGLSAARFKDLYLSGTATMGSLNLGGGGGEKLHVYDGGSVKAGFGVDLSGSSRELSMFHSTSGTNGNISFGKRLESNGAYTEAMRIDGSGNLMVGTTGVPTAGGFRFDAGSDSLLRVGHASGVSTGSNYLLFYYGASVIGSVTQHGTSQVLYNISSDQRLKENIADADDAGSKIDAIQVRKYDWKADGSHQDYGMIAQELQAVAPEAVSGDADSEDMMGVDYSKLVPMLVKEIQSLRNRVAQLEE